MNDAQSGSDAFSAVAGGHRGNSIEIDHGCTACAQKWKRLGNSAVHPRFTEA